MRNNEHAALDDAILAVMQRARMTYHIANCLRFDYKAYRTVKTSLILRRLKRMEETGLVSRAESDYKTQIAWVRNQS